MNRSSPAARRITARQMRREIQWALGACSFVLVMSAALWGSPLLAAGLGVLGATCLAQSAFPRVGAAPAAVVALLVPVLADAPPEGVAVGGVAAVLLGSLGLPPLGVLAVAGAGVAATALAGAGPLVLCGVAVVGGAVVAIGTLGARRRNARRHGVATRDRLLARYTLSTQGAMVGLWHWVVAEERVSLTPPAERLLGLPAETEHPLDRLLVNLHPGDREAFRGDLEQLIHDGRDTLEHRVRGFIPDAGERTFQIRATVERGPDGRALRIAGAIEDVSVALRQERELQRSAFHDPLTGLPNRALFLDRLAHAVAQQRRAPARPFAVLFMDIDHFKNLNDSLGHSVGDALLRGLADRLDALVRPADTLGRLGGDEFVVLALDADAAQAEALAARIVDAVRAPLTVMGHVVVPSVSIGVAVAGPAYTDALELLRDADTAMYRAKRDGRARYSLFTDAMHASAVQRLEVERDLHWAVERRELEVHYQPIIDLATLRICGFEALVRWRRGGQLIPPDRFIPIAEETGQIVPMTWWILEEACTTLAAWRREGLGDDLWVHVNFSGRQLSDGDALGGILAVVERCGLPPHALHIELTETSVLRQGNAVDATLADLRNAGLELHLDDFGTGYSSISYLHRWRFDGIKVDRSFIERVDTQPQRNIVAAVIQLAHGLDMHVVAEGVETEAQADTLRALGCAYAQGYLYSRPLPADRARTLLEESRLAEHAALAVD